MTTVTVCQLDEIEPDSARRIDVDGHRLALIRFGDDVHVIGDRCSHADYSLAEGELDCDDKTVECWKHGSAFSVITGEPDSFPATKPVPVYEVAVVGGAVEVKLPEEAR
ncbi:MAG: non-heme iron oxygenase ferredoxin subunit [Actinomycetota bacterium]